MHRLLVAACVSCASFEIACSADSFSAADASPETGNDVVVGSDTGLDAVDAFDAAADAGTCRGQFGAPTLVLAHSPQYIVDSFTTVGDELHALVTLVPTNATTEERKVYALDRTSAGDAFTIDASQPLDLTNVGPTPGAFDAALSADGLTLFFSHEQTPDGGTLDVDLYEAQRPSLTQPFATTSKFGPGIDDPTTNQFHAHSGGANLYFTVAQITNGVQGARDLYVASLGGGVRMPIAELDGVTSQEENPVPSRDELEIFFASNRAVASETLVYRAARTSTALAFDAPVQVPLSIVSTDITPQYLSADGCRLYVLVDQADVYVSQRSVL
jgi:hypothetical protein